MLANDLADGYGLRLISGDDLVVGLSSYAANKPAYNLTVKGDHTYFIGRHGVLTHNSTACRVPHRTPPRLDQDAWNHINARHMPPNGAADHFPAGTTRDDIEQLAIDIVSNGTRSSDPAIKIQVFEKKIVFNGMKARYRVVVDSDDSNRIITIFPVLSE